MNTYKLIKNHIQPNFNLESYVISDSKKDFFHYPVTGNIYDEVKKWFNSKNLYLVDFNVLITPPGKKILHHIDYKIKNRDLPKINWVFGGGVISWYKTINENEFTYKPALTDINAPYFKVEPNDCVLIDKMNVNGCAIVNSGIIHAVENNSFSHRYCFSALPAKKRKTLSWDDAVALFD